MPHAGSSSRDQGLGADSGRWGVSASLWGSDVCSHVNILSVQTMEQLDKGGGHLERDTKRKGSDLFSRVQSRTSGAGLGREVPGELSSPWTRVLSLKTETTRNTSCTR